MEKILVLLSTYNGSKYIEEQIQSILSQKNVETHIIVRDDGSSDGTQRILDSYQEKGVLRWYSGENIKPARSFLDLINRAGDYLYYAFCDQDDVWDSDKLWIAICAIKNETKPALYCSNTLLVDANLNKIKISDICENNSFVSSLIYNSVTGCTAVFNSALKDLVCMYSPSYIDMHDWWIYRICMAFDGAFFFDQQPHILYRQHGGNVIGGLGSASNVRKRHIGMLKKNGEGPRYSVIKELYIGYKHILPKENAKILELAYSYKRNFASKFRWLMKGVNAIDSFKNKRNFVLAVLLNKF